MKQKVDKMIIYIKSIVVIQELTLVFLVVVEGVIHEKSERVGGIKEIRGKWLINDRTWGNNLLNLISVILISILVLLIRIIYSLLLLIFPPALKNRQSINLKLLFLFLLFFVRIIRLSEGQV